MKLRTFVASLLILAATLNGVAQTNSFEKELTAWHKKAAMTCGMIKGTDALAKSSVISKNLEELGQGLEALTQKYKSNPPAEYKNDPLWQSYFADFADNLTVVNHFANKQEYRIASKSCSVFCQTVLRMHKNNGTADLADMLFSLNMQLKLTTDISNTGNAKGAKENTDLVKKIMEHASMKVKNYNADIQALFVPVDKTVQEWLKAVEVGNATSVKALYTSFTPDFQKLFMSSMQ